MLDSLLRYDFPEDSSDPFDISSDKNYFVFANAYSNLSNELSSFSFSELQKHIPMGYKTIVICYRLSLIDNGKEIANWSFADTHDLRADTFSGMYFLTTNKQVNRYIPDWNRNIQTAVIYKPDTTDGSLSSSVWDNFQACKNFALQNSIDIKCKQLLSVILDTINWH